MTYTNTMDWIPTPGSAKARLAATAMEAFLADGFEKVNVVELARQSGVTTGTLYHHFGSKLGLYNFIREELERRVVDRMEGASSVFSADVHRALSASLLVGFDAAVKLSACRILSEPPQGEAPDRLSEFLDGLCTGAKPHLGPVLMAAMRAAWRLVVNGVDPAQARTTLEWILR